MILSNNSTTYIRITMCDQGYGTKIYKKYRHRWVGPSAPSIFDLYSALWNTKNYKENL